MFGEMSDLVYKINAVREGVSGACRQNCRRRMRCASNSKRPGDKADAMRKKIVATKEGGAITGEQRLREFTDDLYGAIMSYEGKPGRLSDRAHRCVAVMS